MSSLHDAGAPDRGRADATHLAGAILDSLADVAWLVPLGAAGASAVTQSYERVFGCDPVRLRADAHAWLDAVPASHRNDARRLLTDAASGPSATFPISCRAGVRWMRARAVPLAGEPPVTLVACIEVSDLCWRYQRAERELAQVSGELGVREIALRQAAERLGRESATREQAERLLRQAEKLELLGRLTPGIAHDFNNLLAVVSGTLHLLSRVTTDQVQAGLITRALTAIDTGSSLVRSLHAFAGDQVSGVRPLDVNRAVADMAPLLRQAVGAGVTVDLACQTDGWVLADPHQFQMALLNLAVNARDAMPDGGRLEIKTRDAADQAPHVLVVVRDTGHGMSAEQLKRATEPFFTTKQPGRGTGLGLPMVETFARASGGELVLESTEGQGTTATLHLCRTVPAPEAPAADAGPIIDRERHGGATVLVVEDDPALRPLTAAYIRDLGYEVIEAEDAVEALACAERRPELALVVTDIELPGMDGVALADRLRTSHPSLGVLFVTAHAEWARADGRFVLQKPFDQTALASRILSALGRASSEDGAVGSHIVHPALRRLYDLWHTSRGSRRIPSFDAVRASVDRDREMAVIARVARTDPPSCQLEHVGQELVALYSTAHGMEAHIAASVQAAYLECAEHGGPSYERLRYRLGGAPPVAFERVIVPCAADGATEVTHLVGLVSFTNLDTNSGARAHEP